MPKRNGTGATAPLLLDIDEVARLLSVSRTSVKRMRSERAMPEPVRVRGGLRWRRVDIEEWIDAGCPQNGG